MIHRNETASYSRTGLPRSARPPAALVVLVCAAALAAGGCGDTTVVRTTADGGTEFRHNGMNFSIEAPAGWTVTPMDSLLLVELAAPRADDVRSGPVVHVFSRREQGPVDLGADVPQLLKLFKEDVLFSVAEKSAPPVESEATLAGLKAVQISRVSRQGTASIDQRIVLVTRGNQVWALMMSVPTSQTASAEADFKRIRDSFKVW